MDKEMLDAVRKMFKEELKTELEPIKADIGEMKSDIKSFKEQFTDFEGKSANNHIQVVNKIDNMPKDLILWNWLYLRIGMI